MELLAPYTPKKLTVNSELKWEMCKSNEVILAKETAFEMGANRLLSVNYSCVTTSSEIVTQDELFLYGDDLSDIKNDIPFARIVLLNINNLNDDTAYKSIKDLEYVKYEIIPKGYMIRASSFDKREQVRVSREAIQKGINFEIIGNAYINKLKETKQVNAVRIIFITKEIPELKKIIELANKTDAITKTLNHVLNNMNFDCSTCNLQVICDEVEGMRELHFKKSKNM